MQLTANTYLFGCNGYGIPRNAIIPSLSNRTIFEQIFVTAHFFSAFQLNEAV
ncbi:MAG: hypothetical protein IPL33_14365 [Sphingobacteriales bacterium]|nr:hypothetical protein [Sphingobacteriales bacterium]